MQFIAEDPIRVVVRSEIKALHDTAGRQVAPKQRRIFAQFKRGIAEAWAVRKAEETFEFRKRAMFEGGGTIPIAQWAAYYDSVEAQQENSWTTEERELIENTLLAHNNCVLLVPEKLAAPYPNYDKHRKVVGKRTLEHAIADITATYESAGFDVGHAVAYEKQEGDNAEVLAALEALGNPVETTEEVIAA